MIAKIFTVIMLVVVAASCGTKKKTEETATATESAEFTELKAIMATDCAGSCHVGTDWKTSETAFKVKLTDIQGRVASGDMPRDTTLTAEKKAKFAAYK